MAKIAGMNYFNLEKGKTLTATDLQLYLEDIQQLFHSVSQQAEELKEVLSAPYEKIYAVGIGDSLYSAESVKFASWKNSGKIIEVIESHEFNNYYINFMPSNSLVLICSGGGSAARTVESYYLAKQHGATVVAVTLSEKSRLRSAGEYSICFTPNKSAYIDGSCNYMSLAAMMLIVSIKLGVWGGNITAHCAEELYAKYLRAAEIGFVACMQNEELLRNMMQDAKERNKFYFLGAGPCYILTEYASAKFMEQAAVDGIHQQLEEYGHEQYWVHNRNGDGDYIFSICPNGASIPRCIENLREQKFLGLTTVVPTTCGCCEDIKALATYVIETPELMDEDDFWFAAGNILARLANFYTAAIGRSEKMFKTDEQFAEHYTTIHYSRFCPEVAEFDIPCPDEDTIRNVGARGLAFENSVTPTGDIGKE